MIEICDLYMPEVTFCGNPGFKCWKLMVSCDFCMSEFVLPKYFASWNFVKVILRYAQKLCSRWNLFHKASSGLSCHMPIYYPNNYILMFKISSRLSWDGALLISERFQSWFQKGFQKSFRPSLTSDGFRISEGFQTLAGLRRIWEGLQKGFRRVRKPRLFQMGFKRVSGNFNGISQKLQRGNFRGARDLKSSLVSKRFLISEKFQKDLKNFREVSKYTRN